MGLLLSFFYSILAVWIRPWIISFCAHDGSGQRDLQLPRPVLAHLPVSHKWFKVRENSCLISLVCVNVPRNMLIFISINRRSTSAFINLESPYFPRVFTKRQVCRRTNNWGTSVWCIHTCMPASVQLHMVLLKFIGNFFSRGTCKIEK